MENEKPKRNFSNQFKAQQQHY